MNSNVNGRGPVAAALIALMVMAAVAASGCKSDPASPAGDIANGIYTPTSKPFGKSYTEWTTAWWQWAFGQAATDAGGNVIHPLLDTSGAAFTVAGSSSGSVIFLGGLLGPGGAITRTIAIPSGRPLFFPIINVFADTTGGWTIDSMRAAMNGVIAKVTTVSAEIDGHPVANTSSYHVSTPQFTVALPERNIYQLWGNPLRAGTVMPYLSEGYWLMLAPLASGSHTIHFLGKTSDGILQDVTYKVTVQ